MTALKLFKVGRVGQSGHILLFVMIFGAISLVLIVFGISGYAIGEHRATIRRRAAEQAFQIAEAGLNYYRWHLAHDPEDYADGTGAPGPYSHEFKDKTGAVIGTFSLIITPPASNSSLITIESTGWTAAQSATKRTLRARIGFKSLSDFAFATNAPVWIVNNMVVGGRLHSNSGIRFDGTATDAVTSAVETYTCLPVHGQGCENKEKPGIWGQGAPQSLWQWPVPAEDFSGVSASRAKLKAEAQTRGLYFTSSGKQGWLLKFVAGNKISAAKVETTKCYKGADLNDEKKENSYCVDIKTLSVPTLIDVPANGAVFVEDTVWVEGQVESRVSLGSGSGKSIIINGAITYGATDGSVVLGLVAAKDVIIPHDSPDILNLAAAVITETGSARRYNYTGDHKEKLAHYGAIISNGTWTWSWSSQGGSVVSGYKEVVANHDPHLEHNPPLGFPRGKEYVVVSWEEVK